MKDLIRVDKPALRAGTAQVIALLTRLARLEEPKHYEPIVAASLGWGFDKYYGANWQGDQDIRDGFLESARLANEKTHEVLSRKFLEFVKEKDLKDLQGWYAHDLREIAMHLLANQHCGDAAEELAEFYNEVNQATH